MKKNGEMLNEEKLNAAEKRILEEKNGGSKNQKLALNLEIMTVQNAVLNVR